MAVEVAAWAGYFVNHNNGLDTRDEYEAFADQYWNQQKFIDDHPLVYPLTGQDQDYLEEQGQAVSGSGGEWWTAQRATAAHSTLVVNDTNACVFAADTGLVRGPVNVTCRRDESEGNTWLEMSHDGYAAPYGVIHHHRLYLTAGGEDLRGEDRIEGDTTQPFVLRFHLHPDVNVSVAQNAQAAILKLPSGGWWRMRARGGAISLADSIYMGKRGEARRAQQIVVTADPQAADHTVRWAITREVVGK